MAWEVWLTFFGAAIAIAVSPGAGAIQSMATGLTHGVRRGYWSILGLEVGLMLQLALVAIGLGAVVDELDPRLQHHQVGRRGLPVLSGRAAMAHRHQSICASRSARRWTAAGSSLVRSRFLVNATNPKGLVFFLAVLPQFVVPAAPLLPQYLAIGVTMVAVDLVVMGLYTGCRRGCSSGCTRRASKPSSTGCFSGLFAAAAVHAVAGAPRPGYRVKTVFPVIVGQTDGASSHGTTRSTAGDRSQVAVSNSRISGITARALTRPVTKRTPRVYIGSSGISTAPW